MYVQVQVFVHMYGYEYVYTVYLMSTLPRIDWSGDFWYSESTFVAAQHRAESHREGAEIDSDPTARSTRLPAQVRGPPPVRAPGAGLAAVAAGGASVPMAGEETQTAACPAGLLSRGPRSNYLPPGIARGDSSEMRMSRVRPRIKDRMAQVRSWLTLRNGSHTALDVRPCCTL